MKFTLNDCVQRINQILNYPAVSYADISHFFDHAISEINTILRIGIPSVSEMVYNNTLDITLQNNTVLLAERPNYRTAIPTFTEVPTEEPDDGDPTFGYHAPITGSLLGARYYIWNGITWNAHTSLYGVCFADNSKTAYIATPVGGVSYWVESPAQRTLEVDLCEYLPLDWWILFVIPYVCFKFAVRNGDDGALYSTEFSEGLQQLQTCYDVPNFVVLSEVAGDPVYTEIVQANLDNLSVKIPTKAIKNSMRIGNAIAPVFGNLYDVGGWNI